MQNAKVPGTFEAVKKQGDVLLWIRSELDTEKQTMLNMMGWKGCVYVDVVGTEVGR